MVGSRRLVARTALVTLTLLAVVVPRASAGRDDDPAKRAVSRLEEMAKLLAKAKGLGLRIDCAWDVVQPTGEKIEFGELRTVTVRRPDRLRMEVVQRSGSRRGLLFDGRELAVFDLDQRVYATAPARGTLDAALEHLTTDLQVRVPLRELIAADLPEELEPFRETARWVGRENVGGTLADHLSLRGDDADVQLWIASQGDPLPRRIVITYRRDEGQPQFRADLSDWNLSPDAPDALFTFATDGTEKVPFVVPRPAGGARGAR